MSDEGNGLSSFQLEVSPVLKALGEQTELMDFVLEGDGGSVQLHACLAAVFSPVFKTAIQSSFKEGKERRMTVLPYSLDTLQTFCDAIYRGKLVLSCKNVLELLQFSHEYEVNEIFSLCEKFLCTNPATILEGLDRVNFCVKAYKCGSVFDSEDIRKAAQKDICKYVQFLPHSAEFLELDCKYITPLMLTDAAPDNTLLALSEWLLFRHERHEFLSEILTSWIFTFLDVARADWKKFMDSDFFRKNPQLSDIVFATVGKYFISRSPGKSERGNATGASGTSSVKFVRRKKVGPVQTIGLSYSLSGASASGSAAIAVGLPVPFHFTAPSSVRSSTTSTEPVVNAPVRGTPTTTSASTSFAQLSDRVIFSFNSE